MKNIKGLLYLGAAIVVIFVAMILKFGCLTNLLNTLKFVHYNEEVATKTDSEKNNLEMKNSKSDNNNLGIEDSESGRYESDEQAKDARYITYEIDNHIKDKSVYSQFSNEKLAWWFKRDSEHGPSGCDKTIDISKYDGYYLDTRTDNNSERVLYLTFDCGYENGYTGKILDVLKEQGVPACFFVTKTYIRDNEELVKRMKTEGHQVGNHTITHPSLPKKSYEDIIAEITGCAEYMEEVTGFSMDPYLRPPMGEYSERTLAMTKDLGYKTIFWSMAYLDYDVNKQPGANYVIEHFNKYHHDGAIILMHNVSSSNAAALESVIINMKEQGYRFASLNELE